MPNEAGAFVRIQFIRFHPETGHNREMLNKLRAKCVRLKGEINMII